MVEITKQIIYLEKKRIVEDLNLTSVNAVFSQFKLPFFPLYRWQNTPRKKREMPSKTERISF